MGNRIGIIGENSFQYLSMLLNIWSEGNCAVLIDRMMPQRAAIESLKEAGVKRCYIEYSSYTDVFIAEQTIDFIPYFNEEQTTPILQRELYERFSSTYSGQEAVVIFSSGTTGKSKGVILSHKAININADYVINHQEIDKQDKIFISRSFSYASGLSDILLALKTGMKAILAPVGVHPRYSLSMIKDHAVSKLGVVPAFLAAYLQEIERFNIDLPNLKTINSAGAPILKKLISKTKKLLPHVKLFNNYGLSEAAPRVTGQNNVFCSELSSGVPINSQIKLRIVDKNDIVLMPGNIGIIQIKTPTLFDGYINVLEAPIIEQGWLKTNDLGYMNNRGELFVKGRADDAILSKAKIVYPEDVEHVILSSSEIEQCVVFGQPDSSYGEKIICLYVANNNISDKLRIQCEKQLMEHEIPKEFTFVNEIPKLRNGKISRKNLQNLYNRGEFKSR